MAKSPIVISGSPRSGSTWLGKVLSNHPETIYIHEPFNIGIKRDDSPFKYWIEGVFSAQPKEHQKEVKTYLKGFYSLTPSFLKKTFEPVKGLKTLRDFRWLVNDRNRKTTILKDPIAFFALEWIYANITPKIIVSIRHPAGVISSLLAKEWGYDFNDMLAQPELMENYLKPFEEKIKEFAKTPPSLLDQGVLLWNCVYHTAFIYQKKHAEDWLFIKNEELSLDSMGAFKKVLRFSDLNFDPLVKDYIEATTKPKDNVESEFVRDSAKNVKSWQSRLTSEEIVYIKLETNDVWKLFYTEEDW